MELPFRLPLVLDPVPDLRAAGLPAGEDAGPWLSEHPGALKELFSASLGAGAQVLCAPTLGASRFFLPGRKVPALNRRLMELSRDAAPAGVPVGGAAGPSGCFVPPHGEADFDDVYGGYREQIRALDEAGADFLLLEGLGALSDLRAALLAARTTGLPTIALLRVDSTGHTLTGGSLLPALITLQAMGADAVGLCCPADPELPEQFLRALPHAAVPLAVRLDCEPGQAPDAFAEAARPFVEAGARIAGAGAGAEPEHVRALAELLKKYGPPELPEEPDCDAAAIEDEAFFLGDDLLFSEPIACTSALGDDLIDLDDERVSAALVEVTSVNDAVLLGRESGMTRLPIAVHADSPTVLDAALRYFQGRLLIDSDWPLDRDFLEPLAAKYGAIIY